MKKKNLTEREAKYLLENLKRIIFYISFERELSYHLQKLVESTEERKKQLEIIKRKARNIYSLKPYIRKLEFAKFLTEKERKKINSLLNLTNIRV